MNILIPNNWLKDYLETNATPKDFAKAMSLSSVSVERTEKIGDDVVFDIEITTNRPDLMSIEGIAREASAVLPQAGYKAIFKPQVLKNNIKIVTGSPLVSIQNDKTLVNRITAVIIEVELKPSPKFIQERLEKTGIRSINNVVDVTNYIMREIGHPVHAFDYDKLKNHTLVIRRSKKGEKITTLDGLEYILPGNDIVADNGEGELVDLLGIMGLSNSAISNTTKRILLFLDNNNPYLLRKTSMNLGIRTEAAILNEKGVDPSLMMPTLLRGIELLKEYANGNVISDIIDIYPNKPQPKNINVGFEKINSVIGVEIPPKNVISILKNLGFEIYEQNDKTLKVLPPSQRLSDIQIPEDIIEEVARIFGYQNIPNILPPFSHVSYYNQNENEFYWTSKIKEAFKFWGFNEVYTYSMVSEDQFDGPVQNAVRLKNPLTEDHVYLRNSLIPSVLKVAQENKNVENFKLFEISNIYQKNGVELPREILHLAVCIKNSNANFYTAKGVVEQIFKVLNIKNLSFSKNDDAIISASIKLDGKNIGNIEVDETVNFELDFSEILKHANSQKSFIIPSKFPSAYEDVRIKISPKFTYDNVKNAILKTDKKVKSVELLDIYEEKKTFRITYLDRTKNLTQNELTQLREKIFKTLRSDFKAEIG